VCPRPSGANVSSTSVAGTTRLPYPHRVFENLGDASAWVIDTASRRAVIHATAPELVRAIESTRGAIK
jgi:hypothetical protein